MEVNPVSFGRAIRALRRRRGWTQEVLGEKSGTSQSAVSRCEGGKADTLTWRTIVRIAEALGARASVTAYWQGEDLDRLLDAAHAGLVDQVVQILTDAEWEVVPEATFSTYGERGSIDVLAYHPPTGALLVIEVKSTVPDMQGMLSTLDRKVRLAPRIAAERGWMPSSVSRLLVIGEDRTSRRRLHDHAATVNQLMPLRTVAMRRWLRAPSGPVGGVLFLTPSQSTPARRRVRRVAPDPGTGATRVPAR